MEETYIKPPYLSVSKMERLLELLSNRSFAQLNIVDLMNRGFSKVESFQALQALRFLGLLDDNGNVQNAQVLSLKGEARNTGLQDIVKKAYKKLFDRIENPNILTRDELHNEFIAEYGLSSRLVKGALPLFLWLSREAGMKVKEEISPRKRESMHKTSKLLTKKAVTSSGNFTHTAPPVDNSVEVGEFKFILPPNWNLDETRKAIAKGDFRAVYEELEKLSAKLKNQTENKDNDAG